MQRARILKTLGGSFGAEVVNKLLPLMILHVVIQRIGPDNYGYAQFGWNLVDSGVPLVVAGYAYLATVELGQCRGDQQRTREILSEVTVLKMAHAAFALVGLMLTLVLTTSYHHYIPVTVPLSLVLLTSALDMSYVHVGTGKVLALSVIIIAVKLLGLALIPMLVHGPADRTLFALLYFGSNGVIGIANFVYNVRRFPLLMPARAALKRRFLAALPFAVTVALTMGLDRYDGFVIEHLFGEEGVGLYGGTVRIVQAIGSVVTAIGMVFFAEVVTTKDAESLTRHVNLGLWAILALILPMAVGSWFVGGPLLAAVLRPEYATQQSVFALLVCGLLFQGLVANYGMQVLMMHKRAITINALLTASLAGGLVAASYLGQRFGLIGVAMATVGARAFAGLGMGLSARRHLLRLPWRELMMTGGPALGMGLVLALVGPTSLPVGIAVGVVVYMPLLVVVNRGKVMTAWAEVRNRAVGRQSA